MFFLAPLFSLSLSLSLSPLLFTFLPHSQKKSQINPFLRRIGEFYCIFCYDFLICCHMQSYFGMVAENPFFSVTNF